MEEGRASRTAQGVAIRRATHQVLDRPLVFEDPFALRIALCDQQGIRQAHDEGRTNAPMRAFMAVRSRVAEDDLAAAVARGATQYVLLGAGLDTFAYRNSFPNLRVFEVDHPATQQWKRERLAETGIAIPGSVTYAPVNFEHQTLRDGLTRADFDFHRITWFAWLGVVPYLSLDAFRATVTVIGSMPEGSGVTFDYSPPRSELSPVQRMALDRLAKRVAAAGEPFQLFFKPREIAAELRNAGFHSIEDHDTSLLNERYFANRDDGFRLWGGAHVMTATV